MDLDKSEFLVVKHRCHNWCCPTCGRSKALLLRKNLHSKYHLFPDPRLLTFTVDPKCFPSPEFAYNFVRNNNFLPRIMRYLKIKNWFCVFECQQSGYPHWHILIDISHLPSAWLCSDGSICFSDPNSSCYHKVNHFLDLSRIHKIWKRWGIGTQIELSRVHGRKSPEHCINYVTKYLTKPPVNGYPKWLLQLKQVRFISASKSLGPLFSETKVINKKDDNRITDDEIDNEKDDNRITDDEIDNEKDLDFAHSIVSRISSCGLSSDLILLLEGSKKVFFGNTCIPPDVMKKLRPNDFKKITLHDDISQKNYTQLILKSGSFAFWDTVFKNPDSQCYFEHYYNKRLEQYGFGVPF